MSGYKRGWVPFWICGSAFYAFTLFGGIMTIRSVILHPSGDNVSPIVFALFMIILGHMMLAGVIISIFYLKGKKTAFISAFMAASSRLAYTAVASSAIKALMNAVFFPFR